MVFSFFLKKNQAHWHFYLLGHLAKKHSCCNSPCTTTLSTQTQTKQAHVHSIRGKSVISLTDEHVTQNKFHSLGYECFSYLEIHFHWQNSTLAFFVHGFKLDSLCLSLCSLFMCWTPAHTKKPPQAPCVMQPFSLSNFHKIICHILPLCSHSISFMYWLSLTTLW